MNGIKASKETGEVPNIYFLFFFKKRNSGKNILIYSPNKIKKK